MQIDFAVDANEPRARGFAQSGVRVANERTVLTLIALRPGSSNADLARLSGLGPQTTSRIVVELENRELIMRGALLRGRRGQPATPLFINPSGAYVIGVEIGWRNVEVVLISMTGQTLAGTSRRHDYPDVDTIFSQVAAEVATLRSGMTPEQADRLVGIGLASPSDIGQGLVALGGPHHQVERWRQTDVAERLGAATGLEVEWLNDGGAACWSELLALPMPWPTSFASLHVGTYVGSGITTNGTLWDDRNGSGANLGAIIVPCVDGGPCTVQTVASLLALQRRLEAAGLSMPTGNPSSWDWAALQPVADEWLEDAARALATAVLSTRAIIAVQQTIIDSVLPRPVLARLVERVNHHLTLLPSAADPPVVGIGALGGAAAASGVAQMLLFRRFFSRAWNLFAT